MKKKILVVEDEESLRKLITILLNSKGYDVRAVSNGQAALDALGEEKPDLVLLNVMLPAVNGFEVCQYIKKTPSTKDIPVVFLAAKMAKEDMARGQQVGADEYLTKPFKSAQMVETIDRLLNSRD